MTDCILYTFSRASNRLTINNSVTGFDQTCAYDGLYQLGECASTTATEEFDYDPTGNWTSYINGSNTQNRTHQTANEISSITGTPSATVGYEPNGNMTTMPVVTNWVVEQTVAYDAWNRLISVNAGGITVGAYQYDGLNRRISKISNEGGTSTTRDYYYSNKWQVLEERVNASPSADIQYVWGTRYEDDIVLRDRFGGTADRFYALADYFQPTAIADTTGVVQETYSYSAFGTPLSSSIYDWEYLFGSYYYDGETGLYQVRNRYYHSTLGRWLSHDLLRKAELRQGANLYWYVQNNAVNKVDALGLAPTPANSNPPNLQPTYPPALLPICVPLPDSGAGIFNNNVAAHYAKKKGQASSLTFNVCCPIAQPHLISYGVMSPDNPPPTTFHHHDFPNSYSTVQGEGPTGSGPRYTIVINVTSTASELYLDFVNSIRVIGLCCCFSGSGDPIRNDPPPLPAQPTAPPWGSDPNFQIFK